MDEGMIMLILFSPAIVGMIICIGNAIASKIKLEKTMRVIARCKQYRITLAKIEKEVRDIQREINERSYF